MPTQRGNKEENVLLKTSQCWLHNVAGHKFATVDVGFVP